VSEDSVLQNLVTTKREVEREMRWGEGEWQYPRPKPDGNIPIPKGLPPCGTKNQRSGGQYNPAGRWLDDRGWYSSRRLARLLNISRSALMRRVRAGKIPYLRVGHKSWWIPPAAVYTVFKRHGDPAAFRAWVDARCPMYPGRSH